MTRTMTRALATDEQIADARDLFAAEPATRAVAFWADTTGCTYMQGQATVDNRPARVIERVLRYVPDAHSLVIITR